MGAINDKMNYIKNFLFFCSGAYLPLLKKSPTEMNKYLGIGGAVFFTAVFAGMSAGYALSTVFENVYWVVVLALVWSLMIFNLDRYIVSSMEKKASGWSNLKMALPRVLIAMLLALVIAKPLELKIFEKEITRQLDRDRLRVIQESREELDLGFPELIGLREEINNLKSEVESKENFRNQKQQEYDQERFGIKNSGTSGLIGLGINARKKENQLDEAEDDFRSTQVRNHEKIDALEAEILRINQQKESEWLSQKASLDNYNGMAAQLDAFGSLINESRPIFWANIFIILLFLFLETAPIIVKLLTEKGPYDWMIERHQEGLVLGINEKWHKVKSESESRIAVFDTLQPEIKEKNISLARNKITR
ncbi:MAG: DUF4407 domain-containing protein [Cyclobacteriaceae bacterium]